MKTTLTLLLALLLAPLAALHAADPKVYDVLAHGAKGDGKTMNTQAIQQAVDTCHAAGGGVVSVPKGVFLTGSLRLKGGVTLRVEKDAILRGSPKIADYTDETAPLHWGGVWACFPKCERPPPSDAHAVRRLPEGDGARCEVARPRFVHDFLRAQ